MIVNEILCSRDYTLEELQIDVYVVQVPPKQASTMLETLLTEIPLQQYGLIHLKRIRSLGNDKSSKLLEIIICPVAAFEEIPLHLREKIGEKSVVKVARFQPESKEEFLSWSKWWPMNYHPSQAEKVREIGFTSEELDSFRSCFESMMKLRSDDNPLPDNNAAIIVNPENKQEIVSSSEILRKLIEIHGETARNHPLNSATQLCIEGIAMIVREEIAEKQALLQENFYLCTGLDLFVYREPDVFDSMALVHSRIGRVFFVEADKIHGALKSGNGHIHALRALNHHYRVFQLCN